MDPIARCAVHPDAPSTAVCSQCGNFACIDCLVPGYNAPTCMGCAGGGNYVLTPWQRREELGVPAALWGTFKEISFEPQRFFTQLDPQPKEGPPYALPFLILIPAAVVGALQGLALSAALESFGLGSADAGPFGGALGSVMTVASSALGPLWSIVGALFSAVLIHGVLWLFGHRSRPLQHSIVLCLHAQCVNGWQAVPVLGLLAGFALPVWTIIGVRHVHGTSWGVAIATVLLPACLLVLLLAMGVGLVAMLAVAGSAL